MNAANLAVSLIQAAPASVLSFASEAAEIWGAQSERFLLVQSGALPPPPPPATPTSATEAAAVCVCVCLWVCVCVCARVTCVHVWIFAVNGILCKRFVWRRCLYIRVPSHSLP